VLTDGGEQQCEDLQRHLKSLPLAQHVERIITSPMRRTIQTAQISLQWLIKSGVPLDLDAMWQENSDEACDTGTSLRKLAKEFPNLDFSTVDRIFPDKAIGTPYAYTRSANQARGEACLKYLYNRPERVIAVVSHGGFLRTGITRRRYANADYRIFTFGNGPQGHLHLWEDDTTSKKGGGMGRSEVGVFEIKEWDFPPEADDQNEDDEVYEDDDDSGDFVDAAEAAPS